MSGTLINLAAEGYPFTMRTEHLCQLLDISPKTLLARIKAGFVPGYQRVGRGRGARYEWLRPDVERWLLNRSRYQKVG